MNREETELRKVGAQGGVTAEGRHPTRRTLQVVIPARFASVLQLEKGDYVRFTLKNKTIILEKYTFKS